MFSIHYILPRQCSKGTVPEIRNNNQYNHKLGNQTKVYSILSEIVTIPPLGF